MTKVINRFGETSEVKLEVMRAVMAECANGLDINLLELESHIDTFEGREVVTTSEIQASIIHLAVSMCTITTTDYSQFAARMLMHETKRQSYSDLGYFQYEEFPQFVTDMVAAGQYGETITGSYTRDQLNEAMNWIDHTRDGLYEYAGMNILTNRYLIASELPQTMFLVISLLLAQNEEETKRMCVAKSFYDMISTKKISLATPILSNLRKPNGNLSSCFITAPEDSLDGIFNTVEDLSKISACGGGVGVNMSKIRAIGSSLNGIPGRAKGIIPWIKIINDTMVAVDQGGVRAGASTIALDTWHLDIQDFLELQTENGDPRRKAFDIFPQVVISNLFMSRVELEQKWTLFDPCEVKTVTGVDISTLWGDEFSKFYKRIEQNDDIKNRKVIDARELMKTIMKTQIETGMPYIFFKDTANYANPNSHEGYIGSANLCVESFSNFSPSSLNELVYGTSNNYTERSNGETHICNLVSLNLSKICTNTSSNNAMYSELSEIHRIAARILDNAIDITEVPVPDAQHHNNKYRVIGIGYMGLHDLLVSHGLMYKTGDPRTLEFVDNFFELCSIAVYNAGIDLAEERGRYDAYEGSSYDNGIILGRNRDSYLNSSQYSDAWNNIFDRLKLFGIRNSQMTAIAPNTSTSNLMGCTASVLPTFAKFTIEKNSNGTVPIFPPFIKDFMWHYNENKHTDQKDVVDIISTIQKWIDTGISMELVYNLNTGITAKDIYDVIVRAWNKGCKAIYYTRTIQNGIESNEKDECSSCAN